MKKVTTLFLIFAVLLTATLACSTGAPTSPTSTPDAQATIDAAIAATANAQAGMQATIDASIASTAIAMPPTPTPGPTVEYVTMTEEELAALIDQAVADAVAATQQTSSAATQATSDNTVTEDELAYIYGYYYLADEAIDLAEEYINAYYGLYADLAYETMDLLVSVEQDLSTTAQSLDEINTALVAISDSLAQGLELATATIDQLNTAAQNATSHLQEAQAQSQTWISALQEERDGLVQNVLSVKPDNVPTDKLSALQSAFSYVDVVKNAFGDNKITLDELTSIAQLGANAAAGLSEHGGSQLQGLSGKLNEITAQIAGGKMPQAKDGLRNFETSLGERPSGPNLPSGGSLPGGNSPGGNLPGGGNSPGGFNPPGGGGGGGVLPRP
jgi:hypothetical protein